MRILTRASMFVAGWAVFLMLVVADDNSEGRAILGIGLSALLVVTVTAAAWGWYDGRRTEYGPLAVTWGVVGVLMAVIVPLFTTLVADQVGTHVLASELLAAMPFTAILVAGPALAAGGCATLRRTPSEFRRPREGHPVGAPPGFDG